MVVYIRGSKGQVDSGVVRQLVVIYDDQQWEATQPLFTVVTEIELGPIDLFRVCRVSLQPPIQSPNPPVLFLILNDHRLILKKARIVLDRGGRGDVEKKNGN